jgi:hypothetical protein
MLPISRIGCLWTVKKTIVTHFIITPHDHLIRFKGTRCILCAEAIEDNSTEMAQLVVMAVSVWPLWYPLHDFITDTSTA